MRLKRKSFGVDCNDVPCRSVFVHIGTSTSHPNFIRSFQGRVGGRLHINGLCLTSVHPVDCCQGRRLTSCHDSLCACLTVTKFFLTGTFLTVLNAF